jgi:hypothetical protein
VVRHQLRAWLLSTVALCESLMLFIYFEVYLLHCECQY